MRTSFAQFQTHLYGACLVLALGGCASLPPPTAEISAAQQAVALADAADAQQYAPRDLDLARTALSRAQAAMGEGKERDARALATLSAASADLARARSAQAATDATLAQRRAEVAGLRQRLGLEVQP